MLPTHLQGVSFLPFNTFPGLVLQVWHGLVLVNPLLHWEKEGTLPLLQHHHQETLAKSLNMGNVQHKTKQIVSLGASRMGWSLLQNKKTPRSWEWGKDHLYKDSLDWEMICTQVFYFYFWADLQRILFGFVFSRNTAQRHCSSGDSGEHLGEMEEGKFSPEL